MNFEDEDFDFAEGFLDEVLPPSRMPSHPPTGSSSERRGGWAAPGAGRPDRPDDPGLGGFSCTPDSVSVSQMFGLRPGAATFPSWPAPAAAPAAAAPAAAPASPEMSTADMFADDDDLMDADLLDACEAAEAAPAAAHLPTVGAVSSQSRDLPSGAATGPRDMLDDIGEAPRDTEDKRNGAKTPPRDPPASRCPLADLRSGDSPVAGSAFPGNGARDSPLAGMTLPDRESRDMPAGSRRSSDVPRSGGRRSTGSAVKRRFPGPAGILPMTGSLLTLAHEVSLQDDDSIAAGEDDDPSLHDPVSESQLSQPEDTAAWEAGPWRRLLAELRLSPADADGLPRRINLGAVRRAAAANQLRKVPLLVAVLHSLEPTSDLSYQATFRDPTGQMEGTVAKDAFEHGGAALRPGCALLLRDVVVWRESARRLYLSVTRRSLVYLAPETPAGADSAPVVRLSELSEAELTSARLVEEPPEVAVLQESPPPSPPRPQLYPTPQLSGGGGSGGGRCWRGRGGRSWRGRGGGGSSRGRPAPYSTPQRTGGGSSRGANSASPALRSAPAASRPAATSPLTSGSAHPPRAAAAAAASPALRLFSRPL
ncbi:uncharacterized protein LOC122384368 [Amphibalanus amphitrite]|uniref:uncharacterized protein LOC122384368 n=1 Tax=Amphibalanus amphitrite TaxID=1232801 RepID=UPI001C91D721|nr:uncharacterized protein LOC122384368 [Amphibalanus amphitrite]